MNRWMILIAITLCTQLILWTIPGAASESRFQSEGLNVQQNPHIAFVNRKQQGDNLILIDPTTNVQKILAQYPASRIVGLPVWSPDCKFILVDTIDNDNKKNITRVNVDASHNSEESKNFGSNLTAYFPKWSPDGTKLLFQAVDFSEGPRNPDIYTLDVLSGDVMNITNSEQPDADPSWSPDGKKIIFSSIRDGHSNIYQVDATGSNMQVVYAAPNDENYGPLFSPDGKSIIFASSNKDIGTLKLITEDQSTFDLLSRPNGTAEYHAWAPDGQYIAIATTSPKENSQLNIIDLKTRAVREIASGGTNAIMLFSWSPDSTQIVFQSNQTGNFQLYTVDIKTGALRQLTKNDQANIFPSWSPNSCLK